MENSKRQCRKCGEIIPTRMIFDGKVKNLQNRKFCLNCSPYGFHNTKPDIDQPTIKKGKWSEWSKEQRLIHTARVYRRGVERKRKLVAAAGGGCIKCGYSKCLRGLSFHHRDRKEKIFPLAINELWSHGWEDVVNEFRKCDLMCLNCHAEIEDEFSLTNENKYREILANVRNIKRSTDDDSILTSPLPQSAIITPCLPNTKCDLTLC